MIFSDQLYENYLNECRITTKISVVIFKEPEESVNSTIESLARQINQDFEYFVYENIHTPEAGHWTRMELKNQPGELKHIVSKSSGDYLLFLKAGDLLSPEGLLFFAREASSSSADVIFSDEISSSGSLEPKPDFAKVMFLSHLNMGRAIIWKREIIEGAAKKLGSTDFDCLINELFLDVLPSENRIRHIDRMLLQRGSDVFTKKDRLVSLAGAFQNRIGELDISGDVSVYHDGVNFQTTIQSRFHFSDIQVILVSYDKGRTEALKDQLKFIFPFEIIVMPGLEFGNELNRIDQGISKRILAVISDQICFVDALSLKSMLRCFNFPDIQGVSPKITDQSGQLIYGGSCLSCLGIFSAIKNPNCFTDLICETDGISDAFFMIRSDIIQSRMPFEKTVRNAEDAATELSLLIKKSGGKSIYCGKSLITGDKSSFDKIESAKTFIYFLEKYIDQLPFNSFYTKWMREQFSLHEPGKLYANTDKKTLPVPGKKILVVSHELSLTGAPIVLQQAVRALVNSGYYVTVVSPVDGPMAVQFRAEGATVIIDRKITEPDCDLRFAMDYDLMIVNTVVPFRLIDSLKNYDIPVLWWIHDAATGYKGLDPVLMDHVSDNIHIYCGGEYARWVVQKYRPKYQAKTLLYGFEDYSNEFIEENFTIREAAGKVFFANIGSIEERKGQDVLAKAIELLPEAVRKKCYFLFVGKSIAENIFLSIKDIQTRFPDSVGYIEQLSRKQLHSVYTQVDSLICSSRDDPMPAFMTEGMMFSKVCICSEFTGTASMINDGDNGFTYYQNNPNELAEKIRYVAENIGSLASVCEKSRLTFERFFKTDIFRENLLKIVNSLISG